VIASITDTYINSWAIAARNENAVQQVFPGVPDD
jgi:hypothetical protein